DLAAVLLVAGEVVDGAEGARRPRGRTFRQVKVTCGYLSHGIRSSWKKPNENESRACPRCSQSGQTSMIAGRWALALRRFVCMQSAHRSDTLSGQTAQLPNEALKESGFMSAKQLRTGIPRRDWMKQAASMAGATAALAAAGCADAGSTSSPSSSASAGAG